MATDKKKSKLRGLKALVHDAVDATTDLVREGHESTARTVRRVTDEAGPLKEPARVVDEVRRLSTDGILGAVKAVNRAVEYVSDAGLDLAERYVPQTEMQDAVPMRSDATGSLPWVSDAAMGLVNAAVGDHLSESDNPLELSMVFRIGDRYVPPDAESLRTALPEPSAKVVLFVHGLATTEWCWVLEAEAYHNDPTVHFGSLLQRDLGMTPIFLRYNGGRRVPDNGRQLDLLLDRLVENYPVPIEELTLICHSMGGLVGRSACHYATENGHPWVKLVRRAFYLGSPHQGAPLAKLGDMVTSALGSVDLPATRITSRILRGRSAGIKDLSEGTIVDDEWLAADPAAGDDSTVLIPHAKHYFISATVTEDADNPISNLVGDLLVRVPSASGPDLQKRAFDIDIKGYGGVMHHKLQNHPAVYEQIRSACEE